MAKKKVKSKAKKVVSKSRKVSSATKKKISDSQKKRLATMRRKKAEENRHAETLRQAQEEAQSLRSNALKALSLDADVEALLQMMIREQLAKTATTTTSLGFPKESANAGQETVQGPLPEAPSDITMVEVIVNRLQSILGYINYNNTQLAHFMERIGGVSYAYPEALNKNDPSVDAEKVNNVVDHINHLLSEIENTVTKMDARVDRLNRIA